MERTPLNTRDRFAGYSPVSILLHWLTAVAVVTLFLTHEDEFARDPSRYRHPRNTALSVPAPAGASRGAIPASPTSQQSSTSPRALVTLAFLLCILTVSVTGLAIPPLEGDPIAFFGLGAVTVPMQPNRALAEIFGEAHDLAGHAFLPLVALHILGALKHHFIDRDAVLVRMFRPVARGK